MEVMEWNQCGRREKGECWAVQDVRLWHRDVRSRPAIAKDARRSPSRSPFVRRRPKEKERPRASYENDAEFSAKLRKLGSTLVSTPPLFVCAWPTWLRRDVTPISSKAHLMQCFACNYSFEHNWHRHRLSVRVFLGFFGFCVLIFFRNRVEGSKYFI